MCERHSRPNNYEQLDFINVLNGSESCCKPGIQLPFLSEPKVLGVHRQLLTVDTAMATFSNDFDSPTRYISRSDTLSSYGSQTSRTLKSDQFCSALWSPDFVSSPHQKESVKRFNGDMTDDDSWYRYSPPPAYFCSADTLYCGSSLSMTFGGKGRGADDDSISCRSVPESPYNAPIGLSSTSSKVRMTLPRLHVDDDTASYGPCEASPYNDAQRATTKHPVFFGNVVNEHSDDRISISSGQKAWNEPGHRSLDKIFDDSRSLMTESVASTDTGISFLIPLDRQLSSSVDATNAQCGESLSTFVKTLVKWNTLDENEVMRNETETTSINSREVAPGRFEI